jgi:hypothetical protein
MIKIEQLDLVSNLKEKNLNEEIIGTAMKVYNKIEKREDDNWDIFYSVFFSLKKHRYKSPTIPELLKMFNIKHTDIPQIMTLYDNYNSNPKQDNNTLKKILTKKNYPPEIIEKCITTYNTHYQKSYNLKSENVLIISLYNTLCETQKNTDIFNEISKKFEITKFKLLKIIKDFEKGTIECVSPKKLNL